MFSAIENTFIETDFLENFVFQIKPHVHCE